MLIMQNLLNGASKNLNVNGLVTPQTFSYSPGLGFAAEISGLVCLLKDDGNTAFSNFGALATLTNGVTLQVTQAGITRTITTLKDNADLSTTFPMNQFGSSAVLSILAIVTPEGFGNSTNVFMGFLDFFSPVTLVDTDVDIFQMKCRILID